MTRAILAVALAAATFALPAGPALADHCGETLQPPCETCIVTYTDQTVCVPLDPHRVVS